MKIKHIVLATTMMVTVSTFAQKEEMKVLKKIYAKEIPTTAEIVEYKATFAKLEIVAIEEGDKVYANFYKVMSPILEMTSLGTKITPLQMRQLVNPKTVSDLAIGLNATLDYEKKSGKRLCTDDINETIMSFKPELMNMVIGLTDFTNIQDPAVKLQRFKDGSSVLYSIYQLDKKDVEKLYYAAGYAVNAEDFDIALQHYNELKKLNYSGEGTTYLAVNKTSKKEESFGTKIERDLYIKAGTHDTPKEDKIPSKRGEIYKNIALILVQKGKIDEAKSAITEARKLNPDDTSLIITEADLYFKVKDFDTYKKLINEALEKNPNDADLVFNLGIVSTQAKDFVNAEKYYLRVLAIDPKYTNAYLNLANLKLQADETIVEEMNKLGSSDKDNKRYEVLKKSREVLFKEALPYLEKAHELDKKNDIVIDNLLSVYSFLEMTDKKKALKAERL